MAVYIYNHSEELWFHNNGKVAIIKKGNKIKPYDVEYFLRVHPDRIDCIEKDPVIETISQILDVSDLKDLVKAQGQQIGELINVIKSSASEVRYIKEGDDSYKPESIRLKEPEFLLSIGDIDIDNITAVGTAGNTITLESDINDKLLKLAKLRKSTVK